LEDLAGFNEDSLFSEFAENAFHVVIPAPKCPFKKAPPPVRRIKLKAAKPRGSAIPFCIQKPTLFYSEQS
jgi:hypothetical protein